MTIEHHASEELLAQFAAGRLEQAAQRSPHFAPDLMFMLKKA